MTAPPTRPSSGTATSSRGGSCTPTAAPTSIAPASPGVHGSDIGIAASVDGGQTWRYRGILPGLEWERGRNTFWAPEVLWADGRYHMYVSYVPGVPHDWSGPRRIIHMTSPDLWDWRRESVLALSSDRVIDACVHRLPSGRWRMWYKDEGHHSHIYAADSDDLFRWAVAGPVLTIARKRGRMSSSGAAGTG